MPRYTGAESRAWERITARPGSFVRASQERQKRVSQDQEALPSEVGMARCLTVKTLSQKAYGHPCTRGCTSSNRQPGTLSTMWVTRAIMLMDL